MEKIEHPALAKTREHFKAMGWEMQIESAVSFELGDMKRREVRISDPISTACGRIFVTEEILQMGENLASVMIRDAAMAIGNLFKKTKEALEKVDDWFLEEQGRREEGLVMPIPPDLFDEVGRVLGRRPFMEDDLEEDPPPPAGGKGE